MKKNKFIFGILLFILLSGCSTNEDKTKVCMEYYSEVVDKYNDLIILYADFETKEYDKQLKILQDNIVQIGENDLSVMDHDNLDILLNELKVYDDEIAKLNNEIENINNEVLDEEYYFVSVTIKNVTLIPFHQLYFYPVGEESNRKNILEDSVGVLDGSEMLNIVNLKIEEQKTLWHLESYDEEGNIIASFDVDLKEYAKKNIVIILEFSFDTMECWIEIQ